MRVEHRIGRIDRLGQQEMLIGMEGRQSPDSIVSPVKQWY